LAVPLPNARVETLAVLVPTIALVAGIVASDANFDVVIEPSDGGDDDLFPRVDIQVLRGYFCTID
jgi:hypothetical protein